MFIVVIAVELDAIVIVMKANGLENDFISPFHLYLKIISNNKQKRRNQKEINWHNVTNIHPFLESHFADSALYKAIEFARVYNENDQPVLKHDMQELMQHQMSRNQNNRTQKNASDRNSDVIERATHDRMSRAKRKGSFKKTPNFRCMKV